MVTTHDLSQKEEGEIKILQLLIKYKQFDI